MAGYENLPMSVKNGKTLYSLAISGVIVGGSPLGGTVQDDTAEYPVNKLVTTEVSQDICTISVSLPFGAYGVIVRLKVSDITSTTPALEIKASCGNTVLKTVSVAPSMLSAANQWECMSVGVDFCGSASQGKTMTVSLSSPAGSVSGITLGIDYIRVVPAGTALGSVD